MSGAVGAGVFDLVGAALAEDVGDGDRTTLWTVEASAVGEAEVVTRAEGIVAGLGPTLETFRRVDARVEREAQVSDGVRVRPGERLLRLRGPLRGILTAERTALNFLGRLSGIATLAARFVEAVRETGVAIVDTRKTTPGWRELEKRAAAAGGARNHRRGLFDMVLIKENHIRAAGGIAAAVARARPGAVREGLEVEVEVTDLGELDEALAAGVHRILLDNFPLPGLRRAVERVRAASPPRPLLEASGGVRLETVREIAATGVDLVSVGAITHSAPALDLSLLVLPPGEGR